LVVIEDRTIRCPSFFCTLFVLVLQARQPIDLQAKFGMFVLCSILPVRIFAASAAPRRRAGPCSPEALAAEDSGQPPNRPIRCFRFSAAGRNI
jgi:hypothetical protein